MDLSKVFTVIASLWFAFWIWGLGYLLWHHDVAGGEAVGWIISNAMFSTFGMAILLSIRSKGRAE